MDSVTEETQEEAVAPGDQSTMVLHTEPTPTDPFEGDSKSFEVTAPINVQQIKDELAQAFKGTDVHVSCHLKDPHAEVSKSNPAVLFVKPGSLDNRKVKGIIQAHTPNPHHGLSEEELTGRKLLQRLRDGEDLSNEDLNAALRVFVG